MGVGVGGGGVSLHLLAPTDASSDSEICGHSLLMLPELLSSGSEHIDSDKKEKKKIKTEV